MANNLNLCQFIGRLGKDVEARYMPNGKAVANISLAVGWKSKEKEGTEWVRVVAFGMLAEIMDKYLIKGSQVYISGRMKTRKWQDQQGQDRYTTEIVADNMQMLDSRGSAPMGGGPSDEGKGSGNDNGLSSQPSPPPSDFEDDIPF